MTSEPVPDVPRLRIRDFVADDRQYHVARHLHSLGRSGSEHTHDFSEVFWLESGAAIHFVNGRSHEIRAGDLVLVRPSDRHGFRDLRRRAGGSALSLVNVAFRREHLAHLRRRYYSGRMFPWTAQTLPSRYSIGARELRRLSELADDLATGPQSRLRLEHFLLELLNIVDRVATTLVGHAAAVSTPDWLRAALAEFGHPEHLPGGVRELARLAGRSPEHVNRIVRRSLGVTTTDVVNSLRLEHAARELSMSARPIVEIALHAGFENLSYFYRLFVRRYGRTPRRFRLHNRQLLP